MLTSRSCDIADISELDLDVAQRDPEFIQLAKKFLKNLKLNKTILPLPQGICKDGEDIVSIVSTCDGGIPGFGNIGYLVCEDVVTQEKRSNIACSKWKISK